MNIYAEVHMGALVCSWKPKNATQLILLPSSVSPNSPSVKQPLNQFSAKNTPSTHRPAHTHSAFQKPSFEGARRPDPPKSVLVTVQGMTGNSQLAVYPQTKAPRKNEREIGVPAEAAERAASRGTNCFPPLHHRALTWLKPSIHYQPP